MPLRNRSLVVCAWSLAAVAASGCGSEGDTVRGTAHPDSILPLASETRQALAEGDSAGPTGQPSVRSEQDRVIASLDSLRSEVARLAESVSTLQGPSAGPTPGGPGLPAEAQSDTAAEQGPTLDVRQTASEVRHLGLRVFWSIVLIILAWMLIAAIVWLLEALAERRAARRLFFKKLIPIARLVIWSLAVYYVITGVFNVDRTGLLAATAALGVGIGFAAQGIIKNFLGGLIIIFDQPFQVGDKVRVGGTYGEVVSIGMRATRIVTPDDNLVSVPNSQVVEDQVANANAGALDCQVVVDLYLPGWVDVAKAKSIAYEAAANSRYIYLKKPIVVNVKDEFNETFLTHLVVKSYVIDTRYEFAFASDVTEAAKMEFLRHGMLWPMAGKRPFFEPTAEGVSSQPPEAAP